MPGNSLDWNPPKGKGGTAPFCNPLLVRPELAQIVVCHEDRLEGAKVGGLRSHRLEQIGKLATAPAKRAIG